MTPEIEHELERRGRVADQMLTAHSVLRERFARRATAFDLGLFAAATVLVATTFLDPAILRLAWLDRDGWQLVSGFLSVTIFFMSVVALRVDWKERASRHQAAVKALSDIKAKVREFRSAPTKQADADVLEFLRASAFVMSELIPIPDSQFPALKARHRRKVELSQLLDSYPSAPLFILRLVLGWRDSRAAFTGAGVPRADKDGDQSLP